MLRRQLVNLSEVSTKLFVSLLSSVLTGLLIVEKTSFLKWVKEDHTQYSSDKKLEYLAGLYLMAGWGVGVLFNIGSGKTSITH